MAAIQDLLAQIQDESLRLRLEQEIDKLSKTKKFGLVFEDHLPECTPLYDMPIKIGCNVMLKNSSKDKQLYTVLKISDEKVICGEKDRLQEQKDFSINELVRVAEFGEPIYPYLKSIDSICNAPESELWHTLIEADNYHALQLLEYLYAGKVDCIYIDPPYNTGAKDWKYNNDYVDGSDAYRHSKWLSFMEKRLKLAKKLLNPSDSVIIITIDEKEYLHLGCLLEEIFPEANIQMITDVINPGGTNREKEFSRVEEYLFICRIGDSVVQKYHENMLGNTDEVDKSRVWYSFCRGNNLRYNHNRQFFPIYIDVNNRKIVKVGEPLPISSSQDDFPIEEGLTAVFPINSNGQEASWRGIPSTVREWVEKGYVRVSKFDKKIKRWTFSYIPSGLQERIESGEIIVSSKKDDGSLDIEHIDSSLELVSPRTVWNKKTHNATDYGASILKQLIPGHPFPYPKSLYSVEDAIRFFTLNKKNALIVDFFAGSGTTLHAVNLLNAQDEGNRRCILVTNNEVSNEDRISLEKSGYKPGDVEWKNLGIARNVTWPRTVCSIKGIDINGKVLEGKYAECDLDLSKGFKSNAHFFELGFLDKTAVALGMQFKELLSTLWMKAGAHGKCPEFAGEELPTMLILPENHMAILLNEKHFLDFTNEVENFIEIDTIYIVTDSEAGYREMIAHFVNKHTYQLYKDYLDNFRINIGR